MPTPTFAQTMLTKYESLLEANAGLKSVVVDGVQTTFEDLTTQWKFWKNEVAKADGNGKPRLSAVEMS